MDRAVRSYWLVRGPTEGPATSFPGLRHAEIACTEQHNGIPAPTYLPLLIDLMHRCEAYYLTHISFSLTVGLPDWQIRLRLTITPVRMSMLG
jgi:hypothetical protein